MKDLFNQKMFFIFSLFGICVSLIMQYGIGLTPCPLCIMQRTCIILIALTSGLGIYFPAFVKKKTYWCLQIFWLISGFFFVLRQLWLQARPPTHLGCMPELDILIAYFPLTEVIKTLFLGGLECAIVSFRFLGLSLAEWSLLYFITLTLFLIFLLRQKFNACRTDCKS